MRNIKDVDIFLLFRKIRLGDLTLANYYNKDLYKILDLTFEATLDDIKKAYRKLAKTYHPDVIKNNADINKFREIKEA